MDSRIEAEFFDEFTAAHHEYDVLGGHAYGRLLREFERRVGPRPGERCVDLGCGTGAFTRRLRRFELTLIGLDISARSIARATADAVVGETYSVADLRSLPLSDGACDIAVFSGVLHHLPTRAVRRAVLAEARRILRPGGRVFSFDPSAHSPSMRLYRDPRSPLYSPVGKTDNEILIDRHELAADLAEARFGTVSVRGIGGVTYRYVEGKLARVALPLYNLYERALEVSPVEDRWGTFLVGTAATR